MKIQLLNGKILEFTNEDSLLEFFFSTTLGKFCIMFNAKMMHTSKQFGSANKFLNKMITKHQLSGNENIN